VCGVDRLSVGRLMPGGSPKAISIWTESAIMEIDEIGKRIKIEM
jgi:hypothetical protein